MIYDFIHSKRQVLSKVENSSWASEMVLNPAIIEDRDTGRIHMLFRATGPWPEKGLPGKPLPFPIFLGYGWSDDKGATWSFDKEEPALVPALSYEPEEIYITDYQGRKVVNHSNGCIEDPRLFYFEDGFCYMTAACRMFPPGPYWENDRPTQCAPDWVMTPANPFGAAASENVTVNVLFKVNLLKLSEKKYSEAFEYITNVTDAKFGEDRDVLFFPERLSITGKKKIIMLQRPFMPEKYPFINQDLLPSIMICAADSFEDFTNPVLHREVLAVPVFEWEKNRIGGSTPPIKTGDGEWLLNYHGKQDAEVGYTQSFMILKEQDNGFPVITHRCSERMIIADKSWEMPGKFKTPCVFITGMIRLEDKLLAAYGAADEKIGLLEIEYPELLNYLNNMKKVNSITNR